MVSLETERLIEKTFWIQLVVVACTKEPQAAEHWRKIFPVEVCTVKALGEAHGRVLDKAMKLSNNTYIKRTNLAKFSYGSNLSTMAAMD